MKKILNCVVAALLIICGASVFTSCSNDDDPVTQNDETAYVDADMPLIILDTDIGSSTDDLFALEMLCRYEQQELCRLLGVVVDREGEDCAACADVISTYFGHGDVPIGLVRDGIKEPKVWIDYKSLPNYTEANGTPMFTQTVSDYSALPDGWQLYRRLLSQQPDHSVSICSVGFTVCLAQLLESAADAYYPLSGVELVRQKVKCLYIQGASFGQSPEPDYNFLQGKDFTKTFFRLWPSDVDIIFAPMETGNDIEYRPEQVIADVSWTDVHPIKQVYMQCDCDTGQKMWDPLTVINAVEGDDVFTLTERGTVVLNDDCTVSFTPSPTGNSRFQKPGDAAWCSAMLEKIRNYNKIR